MASKELKSKAQMLKPIVNIGKNGLTTGTLSLLERELKQKKLIKVKILQSMKEHKETLIQQILENTGAELVQKVGGVIVLFKQ